MNHSLAIQFSRVFRIAAAICLVVLPVSVFAHEPENTIADPGFRPPSEYARVFLESLDTATIAVYPTIVRRANRTAHSFASQDQIISFLNKEITAITVADNHRIDLGRLQGGSQWEIFQNDMPRISEALQGQGSNAEYRLVMEFLLPLGDQQIFGIHCYILDQKGQSAFSFLLNSHHQLFDDANLMAEGSSEAARSNMMSRATQAAVKALEQQIENARRLQAGLILHESPIDETTSMMTFAESDLRGLHIADKTMALMCECARETLNKGYQYFMIEEPREKSDTRMRFKISFYKEPPPGLPVIKLQQVPGPEAAPGKGVLAAEDWAQFCAALQSRNLEK